MTLEGLRRLKVWVKAQDFALKIYSQVLPLLPAEKNGILLHNSGVLLLAFQPILPKDMVGFIIKIMSAFVTLHEAL